ncbi:MAG: Gfo/Idh/MocA family oxidoreductase [Lentisphaeria bacterium]|nr:Gfo/Idh/MocA family oxidoreductase [Lentisphaeria bacterium]
MSGKIKIGLWGIGRSGWLGHLAEIDRFPEFFEVVAGCDLIKERSDKLVERYPGAKGYTDYKEFLADENIDLVSVATYSSVHVKHAEMVLEAGKYLFLEKPIGVNYAEALKLKELEAKYPNKIFIRHNRRFESAFNHLLEIMDSGILGEIYEVKLCRHRFQLRNDWQTIKACNGGQLNNWGPHLIDHAIILMQSPIKEIWSDLKNTVTLGDAEDHLKVIFRGENGRVIDLEISDCVRIASPVYAVYGSRGSLVSYNEKEFEISYLEPSESLPPKGAKSESPDWTSGYGGEIKLNYINKTIPVAPSNGAKMTDIYGRLYKAIKGIEKFPITLEQALEIVRVSDLIRSQN